MILKSNANVVCLQECTQTMITKLTQNKQITTRYKYWGKQEFKSFYGCVILSWWPPSNIYEYQYQASTRHDTEVDENYVNAGLSAQTQMGRALLIAEYFVCIKNKADNGVVHEKLYPIYIATSHFESMDTAKYR